MNRQHFEISLIFSSIKENPSIFVTHRFGLEILLQFSMLLAQCEHYTVLINLQLDKLIVSPINVTENVYKRRL